MVEQITYLRLSNSDGKIWLLPSNNLKTALSIYQPSSMRGKLLKVFLPMLCFVPIFRYLISKNVSIQTGELVINDQIKKEISAVFGMSEQQLSLSFFLGTPSKHQKTTVQVSCGKKVLGYCKLSKDDSVKQLFFEEKNILNMLEDKGIKNVPKCLLCKELSDDYCMFIQSTVKSNYSRIIHKVDETHILFQTELHERTKMLCDYSETDYAETMASLERHIDSVGILQERRAVLEKAIFVVKEYWLHMNIFSVYHGDFTPWNTFKEQNQIFAFDFEYAKLSFPPYLDLFHYFTQVEIFKKHKSVEEIWKDFNKEFKRSIYDGIYDDASKGYLSYLLAIIEFYVSRDNEQFTTQVSHNIMTWLDLVEKLLK